MLIQQPNQKKQIKQNQKFKANVFDIKLYDNKQRGVRFRTKLAISQILPAASWRI